MAIPKPGSWTLKSVYKWPSYGRSFEKKKSGADQLTEAVTGKKKPESKTVTSVAGKSKATLNQVGKKATDVLDAKGKIRHANIDRETDPDRKKQMQEMYEKIDKRSARKKADEHRSKSRYEQQARTKSSLKSYNRTSKKKDEE